MLKTFIKIYNYKIWIMKIRIQCKIVIIFNLFHLKVIQLIKKEHKPESPTKI